MDSQKIIHTVRRLAFEEWGGAETVVWQSARALINQRIPSTILATSALAENGSEIRSGCLIKRFPYSYTRLGLSQSRISSLDKKGGDPYSVGLFATLLKSDCRLMHAHSMQRIAAMTRLAAYKKGIPYVVSLQGGHFNVPNSESADMDFATVRSLNYGCLLDIISRPSQVLEDASGIICVGQSEHEVVKAEFPEKPTIYLPNGVDTGKFGHGDGSKFRKQYGIPAQKRIILCVSRIDPQKNQMALVELLVKINKKLPGSPFHLVLVGPAANEQYVKRLTDHACKARQKEHLTLITGLSPECPDLVNAYHAGDYFILPSVNEPFGIVVLEAWAAGIPVIASRTGGLSNLVNNNVTGLLFDTKDPRTLERALSQLVNRPALVERLVARGRERALLDYSWDQFGQKLLSFYDEAEYWFQYGQLKPRAHA